MRYAIVSADTYEIAERFRHFLRVTDVVDGLDAVGRADVTLVDAAIRPLWFGLSFWGPAVTMRVVPANQRMPLVDREDALRQHGLWFQQREQRLGRWGEGLRLRDHVRPGCVVVTSTGGAKECGYWGSNNSMEVESLGAVGIVTEGNCRDTDEVILQRTPVACRAIGRPIIPGRVELVDLDVPVGLGSVLVRPGDIVGCDWDGCVVVPSEIASDVLYFAARIAIDDKRIRAGLYEKLGKEKDHTVDWEAAAAYFHDIVGDVR
ncbi:MAG: RraA family protein [Chloroflexi bacterium]|nr:RraA family protein [Chloroflexota bacterium]